MIPTKTYPLSAIMGEEKTDKERIAELTDAFNRVCDENADFVAESIKDETRIAELQDSFEDAVTRAEKAENRIAELEAQLKHCAGHAAELEAEVKHLRDSDYQRHVRSLEQRLVIAMDALESIAVDSQERFIRNVARAALAQIEEGK
jgi:chromosome segregation ATPase